MDKIPEIRGKRKRQNAPALPISTVLHGKQITQFQELLEHPSRALADDMLAAPSLILKRAVDFYSSHVATLNTEAAITNEKLKILQLVG